MFSMLRLAMTLLICILIVGFYLGWFTFSRPSPDPQSNKVNINVSVDENKVRSDLQRVEQNVAKRIQDVNQPQPPQAAGGAPLAGQKPVAPRPNFGPISVQPSGPTNGQPVAPRLSIGPFSLQAPNQPVGPPSGQPTGQPQTPEFQFTVPLTTPPPGDGR